MTGLALGAGAVMLLLPGALLPQQPPAEAAPFVVRQWVTSDGLPQNSVNDIAQTSDGYLWLATFGGLARFDGVRFGSFTTKSDSGIGSDRVLNLAADRAGRLWAGTENGLIRLERGRFVTFTVQHGLPDNLILSVYADSVGIVWVATEAGVARFQENAGRFTGIGPVEGVPRQFAEDDAGALWLRTDSGMYRFDRSAARFQRDPLPSAGLLALSILGRERSGALWIRTGRGLVRWHGGRATSQAYRRAADSAVTRIVQAPDGALWMASTTDGVSRGGTRTPLGERGFSLPGGASRFNAKILFVDREGQVWAGTNVEGLVGFRRRVFAMMSLVQQAEVSTTAILGDREGRVWIGSNCDDLNVLENGRLRRFAAAGRTVPCVWSAAQDSSGALWFGTWGGYLHRYRNGVLDHVGAASGLSNGVILALHASPDGSLWIGTHRGGLNRLLQGRVTVIDTLTGLPSNQVLTIQPARAGGLWIGTTGGLALWHSDTVTAWTTRDGLSHNAVRAVLEDADGTLWIGTYGGGLTRMKNGALRAISTSQGLLDDAVSAIVDDGRGNLWISGNHGIFRLSRDELNAVADGRAASAHAVGYRAADGLETEETNGGFQPSAWRAPDGRIWFPTIRGVAILDPSAVERISAPPHVHLERLVVDGREVPLAGVVRLPRGSGNVEVHFSATSSPAPEAVVFRYRMRGADPGWIAAGERRVAYYTRLRPGRYQFAVAAANRDGVWSADHEVLALRIAPPVHGTWWFRLIAALTLLATPAAMVLLRMEQRARAAEHAFARRLIDGQELERKRIASELHDSIGQDLLVMKNRAELALRAAPDQAVVREQLEQISHIASDSLRQTRAIAHNLRPAQLDRLGLTAAVRSAVEQVAAASGVAFAIDTGPVDGLLPPEGEIGVFRIVQEGVNNILRHANATSAAVQLVRENGVVRLRISDNGAGFSRQPAQLSGFGISGIAERVRILGGSLDISSSPGQGSTLAIEIPLPRPDT